MAYHPGVSKETYMPYDAYLTVKMKIVIMKTELTDRG